MVQPIGGRLISADFYTTSHYIFGQTRVVNAGMMGILGDPNTSFLEVSEASIARVQDPDKVINYSPLTWVVKKQLVAVCLPKRDYVGAQSLMRAGYQRVFEFPVQITTANYELQGLIEWSGRFDFSALMAEGTNPYIVIFDAVLVSTLFPKLRIESPVMLLNRTFLDSLVVMKPSG
jgi:hypothetical protein